MNFVLILLSLAVFVAQGCNDGYISKNCDECAVGYNKVKCLYPFIEGCPWSKYKRGVDWQFMANVSRMRIEECNHLCLSTDGCHKFEYKEGKYCSSWLKNACNHSNVEVSSGITHQASNSTTKVCKNGLTFQCIRNY